MPADRRRQRTVIAAAVCLAAATAMAPATAHAELVTGATGSSDFDGDGIMDLAMAGFDDLDTRSGTVVVDYSSPLPDGHLVPAAATADTGFGVGYDTGDINGDGFDDLAVGCDGCEWGDTEPSVSVWLGSFDGLVAEDTLPVGRSAQGVAIGNVTGDSGQQVVSTAAGADVRVDSFQDGTWTEQSFTIAPPPTPATRAASVAVGDVTGDGTSDVVVGTPTRDGGSITVFEGPINQARQNTYDAAYLDPALAEFGAALVTGDQDGDGIADIVVGAPGSAENGVKCGAIYVITASGGEAIGQETKGVPGRCEAGDNWGESVAMAYQDGTNVQELFVGAPGEDIGTISNAGSYAKLACDATGTDCTGSVGVTQNSPNVPGVPETRDRFGSSLRVAPEGLLARHLLVGAPGEDVGAATDSGGVLVAIRDDNGQPGPDSYDVSGADYGVTRLGWSLG